MFSRAKVACPLGSSTRLLVLFARPVSYLTADFDLQAVLLVEPLPLPVVLLVEPLHFRADNRDRVARFE